MVKNANKGIFILVILLAVFSMIAFVIPFPKNAVFWIAYICGVMAILFQLYTFKSSFGKADARSRFYGFPIARLGLTYLAVQLLVSVLEIALSKILPIWAAIIINVLILAAALIGCITTETMRDEIAAQDRKLKKDVSNMRELQSLSASIAGQCKEKSLKQELERLTETFRFSDPVTSDRTQEVEADLLAMMNDLQKAVADGDMAGAHALCDDLNSRLVERNRICAVNK